MTGEPLIIAGRYELEDRLGAGGMATVHLAFDRRLERNVAVKLLAEHLADDPSFVSRFRREALAAARLVHPNIVQVFDFGFDERSHHHFIVMEHIDGVSCARLLRDRGRLEPAEAVDLCVQACRGLDYAHRNGVIHRDVKPGNLLRSSENVLKLADFGIAKAAEQSSITQVGSVLGTAAYLAPEQARGEEAGPLADLYSLAVVAYQLMSGRLPYEATSLSELALKQQREPPPPLDQLSSAVPAAVAQAVASGLAMDPAHRPDSAMGFAGVLRNAAEHGEAPATAATAIVGSETAATRMIDRGAVATPPLRPRRDPSTSEQPAQPLRPRPAPRPAPRRAAEPAPRRTTRRPPPKRRRGPRILALLLVLLIAAAIAVGVIATQGGKTVSPSRVTGHDFQQVYDKMRNLIEQNAK
ncbi:MAG TPA: protein kinase [Solirubrobacteraceae bacterium]